MSARPLVVSIDIEGLDLLADALLNAPATVAHAADLAGRAAIPVLRRYITEHTHEVSGDLKRAHQFWMEGYFEIKYANDMPYAQYEEDYHGFYRTGVDAARSEVDAIYEAAYDDVARDFGSGQ